MHCFQRCFLSELSWAHEQDFVVSIGVSSLGSIEAVSYKGDRLSRALVGPLCSIDGDRVWIVATKKVLTTKETT